MLPKFENPPVIETVIGFEFIPLEKWGVPHFGLWWDKIRDEFPKFDTHPPLESQIENFEKPVVQPAPRIQFLTKPEIRCWFVDAEDRMIMQVQHNRFHLNWRKKEPSDSYPHFDDTIRPAFESQWSRFLNFVDEHEIGDITIVQCEITYINHLEIGAGWRSPADLKEVFPFWNGKTSEGFLPAPEKISFSTSYVIPERRGRLHVSVEPAIRRQDGAEILQLNLTARGRPDSGATRAALEWLCLGHEWVVRGFSDLTTRKMHTLWKRKN